MLNEIEYEVYKQLFAEGSLFPEPVEVASLLQERGVEPTDEAIEHINSLLYEDFIYCKAQSLDYADSVEDW